MPLPGGATDKFGNRYEGIWTVRCMTDVMSARADSIRLEPPGVEGEGVEFWLKKYDSLEYHQVKRQTSPSGHWTITDLGNKEILMHMWEKLHEQSSSFIFVSTNSAFQIEELSDKSRRAASFVEFKQEFIKAKSSQEILEELCRYWNNCSEEEAYSILLRIRTEIIAEGTLHSAVEDRLATLINENPANALDILAQFALDRVHHELSSEDIWSHLESRGFSRRQPPRVEFTTGDFGLPVPSHFIGRAAILEELTRALNENSTLMVGGIPGIGKTYLVSKYIENVDAKRQVLWLDCGHYDEIEKVLVRIAEFLTVKSNDDTLLRLLRNSLGNTESKLETAARLCDKYECALVWDNFDPEKHKSLVQFFLECNRIFRTGKLIIVSRTSVDFNQSMNPIYKLTVPPLSQDDGVGLMRYYFERLGLESFPEEIFIKAYQRVDGHPIFLSWLADLSSIFPLSELLDSLPQLPAQIQEYLQQQIFSRLEEGAQNLIKNLSILRTAFTITAIHSFDNSPEAAKSFETLARKFLISRVTKKSSQYEVHDLVREYGLSRLTGDEQKVAHTQAINYYEALEPKTYNDLIEIINHALDADLLDKALIASDDLVSSALHAGLFDLVIAFTSQLFEDKRTSGWSKIFFLRGRAFRYKRLFSDALESYEKAAQSSSDEEISEFAKLEIANVLMLQDEQRRSRDNFPQAKEIYESLANSANLRTRISALTSLGYVNVGSGHAKKGIAQLKNALQLAESQGDKRDIRQVCQGLTRAYLGKDIDKAIRYLERADELRRETSSQYGSMDIDADYFLYEAFANVYNAQKRFADAVKASEECVKIDRKLKLEERLAHSLFQLGRDLCHLKQFDQAREILQESLVLIRKHNMQGDPETITLVWLATALWNSGQYENALEAILEYNYLNRTNKNFSNQHVIARASELKNGSKIDSDGASTHILVLPRLFSPNTVEKLTKQIVTRRPYLADVMRIFLQKG